MNKINKINRINAKIDNTNSKDNLSIFSNEQIKIMHYLLSIEKEISIPFLVKEFKKEYTSILRICFRLSEKGIVSLNKVGNTVFVKANENNVSKNTLFFNGLTIKQKRIYNIVASCDKIENTELSKIYFKTYLKKDYDGSYRNSGHIRNSIIYLIVKGFVKSKYYGKKMGYVYWINKECNNPKKSNTSKKILRKPKEI